MEIPKRFGLPPKDVKPAMSGMETMLRSLGMGEMLDTAKQLAHDGTFQKIIEFAEKADKMQATLDRIEDRLNAMARPGSLPGTEIEPGSSILGPHSDAGQHPVLGLS